MALRTPKTKAKKKTPTTTYEHGGHASPKKHRVVYNFLSFYSVILKLGTMKELVIV